LTVRVALLTYSTKPRGGVVHTLDLAEALAAAGVDVTVWSLARSGDRGFFRHVDPRVRVRLIEYCDRAGETVTERIVRSIALVRDGFARGDADARYDVVHAQDCISANAVGPCIRTIHHLDEFTTPVLAECHEKAVVEPYARICVSAAVAAEVQQGWGLTPTVIPNGVRAQRFIDAATETPGARARRDDWRRRLGRYVLAVGGIEPRKGTLDLVDAHHILRRGSPDVGLVIAGGETLFDYRDYRSRFDARCAELDVRPVILGAVQDDDLPSLVAASEAFAFPSTKEGFGLAAMEALAAGRPVVARDLPVLREVFGDTVRYATTPDTFAGALSDAVTAGTDPAPGRALASSLTWAESARRHAEFYDAHPRPH
jgi:glycosyltransferase-like protein